MRSQRVRLLLSKVASSKAVSPHGTQRGSYRIDVPQCEMTRAQEEGKQAEGGQN
jgi:hypothetical protein